MNKKNHLFQLIQSLNQGEKRYFKLFASTFEGKNKTYIKLFDAIAKQKEYDERALKKKFKNESFVKHFAVAKSNLFNLILRVLRFYHTNNHPREKVNQYKDKYVVLLRKGLHELATIQLDKAMKIAEEYELHSDMVLLAHWQNNEAFLANFHHNASIDAEQQLAKPLRYAQQLNDYCAYVNLHQTIQLFHIKNDVRTIEAQKELQALINHPLLLQEEEPISVLAKDYKMSAQHHCYASMKKYEKAGHCIQKMIQTTKENPLIFQGQPLTLYAHYSNLIFTSIHYQSWSFCQEKINECKAILNDSQFSTFKQLQEKMELFTLDFFIELEYHLLACNFEKVQMLLSTVEEEFESIKDHLNNLYFLHYNYGFAYAHFGIGNYEEAQQYSVILLNSPLLKTRKEYLASTHLLNLLIHYELGNREFLSYQLKNVKQMLQRHQYLHGFEAKTIEFLSKLSKVKSKEQEHLLLQKYQVIFEEMSQQSWEIDAFERFNMCWWIETKLAKIKASEVSLSTKK